LLPWSNYLNVDISGNPIYAPRRMAARLGLYAPTLPGLKKMDFRIEAATTDPPTARSFDGKYVYWDFFYHTLYTNDNKLIGDWVGREGEGLQVWTTYHFSPRSSAQIGFRHAKVAADFITGGETVNDGSAALEYQVRSDWTFSAAVQFEKWLAPILAPTAQTNWTSSVGVTYWPRFSMR